MADWATPTLATIYSTFLTNLSDRLVDSGTLFSSAPTNAPDKIKRWNASTNIFEVYASSGATWSAMVLGVAGGGTGAITAGAARTSLGLGTIATQDSSNVTITGGAISGLTNLSITGTFGAGGKISTTSAAADAIKSAGGVTAGGTVPVIGVDGRIPAISSTYFANLSGANLTGLGSTAWSGLTGTPPAVSTFSNDVPYLTSSGLATAIASYLTSFTGEIIPSIASTYGVGSIAKPIVSIFTDNIYAAAIPSTTSSGVLQPLVIDSSDGRVYKRTNGVNVSETGVSFRIKDITVVEGIITDLSLGV